MIVRISGEDQYRLAADRNGHLQELDDAVLAAVESGDEARFRSAYTEMLEYVRTEGSRVADDDLERSDLILPPPDLTLVEAAQEFTGEGLIPDD